MAHISQENKSMNRKMHTKHFSIVYAYLLSLKCTLNKQLINIKDKPPRYKKVQWQRQP